MKNKEIEICCGKLMSVVCYFPGGTSYVTEAQCGQVVDGVKRYCPKCQKNKLNGRLLAAGCAAGGK